MSNLQFPKFNFTYEVIVDEKVVDKGKTSWQDRSPEVAKDNLRLALQTSHKSKTGVWPKIILECVDNIIKNVGE